LLLAEKAAANTAMSRPRNQLARLYEHAVGATLEQGIPQNQSSIDRKDKLASSSDLSCTPQT
jgi:hypothetical protein